MQILVWLSYDLGVRGDYTGLYEWLDDHKAKECGNSVAFFKYDIDEDRTSDFSKNLKDDIENKVEFKKHDRIYIMFKDAQKKIKGTFLFGKRKSSPWKGYGGTDEEEIDE